MRVVYAKTNFTHGAYLVQGGQHWPADDPVVLAQPGNFSDDPRYGLSFSVEPADFRVEAEAPREKRAYVRHQ